MAMQVPNPMVRVKPQPDIYTLLLVVGILLMAIAIGVVLVNLLGNYGLSFGQIFTGGGPGLPQK